MIKVFIAAIRITYSLTLFCEKLLPLLSIQGFLRTNKQVMRELLEQEETYETVSSYGYST
jgi:hypothetical protein